MSRKKEKKQPENGLPQVSAGAALRSLLKLFWQYDRGYYGVLFFLALFGAASGLINLVLPKMLIDGFTSGWRWDQFVKGILLFALCKYLILQLMNFLLRKDKLHGEYMREKVPMVFAEKVMRLHYPQLEDPKVLDLKERALFPITNYGALQGLLSSTIDMMTGIFTLLGMAVLLFRFSPWFLLVLLVLCLISSLLSFRFVRFMQTSMQELIPVNRRYGYWVDTTLSETFQKEFRIYGLHEVLKNKISSYTTEITDWLNVLYTRQGNNETLQTLITALMRFMAYGYAALRVLGSQWGAMISLGDYSVIVMVVENFFSTFQKAFAGLFQAMASIGHLTPFSQFMRLPEAEEEQGDAPAPLKTLVFEGVTFRYPAGDRQILDHISFEVKEGEKISIVGLNNAGKSTIVKLICRLFEPQEGRILWNGRDIREYDYQAYLKELSCVFQDFHLFPFSLRDNIDTEGTGSAEGVREVLAETGMESQVERLPGGINTYLNKAIWEEAADFSGGEKQKLAIARSLFRPASLVILDEPTAALDPLAESEVYEHFHQLTRGRTAIFISHRMSSSTFCDRILLLQDGRVAAFDSHQNLMQGHNLYRDLFNAQAQHFREKSA